MLKIKIAIVLLAVLSTGCKPEAPPAPLSSTPRIETPAKTTLLARTENFQVTKVEDGTWTTCYVLQHPSGQPISMQCK